MPERSVTFLSEGLALEGVLHVPDGDGPFPGVVVCHPHPRMGGDMYNNVVTASCWGLQQQGVATLRFNFRGVGGSQGISEAGDAEVLDACHALEFLQGIPGVNAARMGLFGYSFGASIALQAVARGPEVQAVGVIGCPAPRLKEAVASGLSMPKLFIAGDMDQAVPGDQFQALTQQFQDPKEVYQILGGDHFLFGHEREIADLVGGFFSRWLG